MRLLEEMNAADWPADMPADAALYHDRYLADASSLGRKRKSRRK